MIELIGVNANEQNDFLQQESLQVTMAKGDDSSTDTYYWPEDDSPETWGDWSYDGWDWGVGGEDWAGDDFAGSWETTETFMQGDIQVIVDTAERMTYYEKIAYDAQELSSKVASTIDNAINTLAERGYFSVGAQNGLGLAVTVDANLDLYVGVTAGRAGVSATVGTTPENVPQTEFLSGWGVTVIVPLGVGGTANSSGMQPNVGIPGGSVGYNVNVSEEWRNSHQIDDVLIDARAYFNNMYKPWLVPETEGANSLAAV